MQGRFWLANLTMNNILTYRTASTSDIPQLKTLALLAYGQFKDVLGIENWKIMESNLSSEEKISELLSKATCFVCADGTTIVGMAYLMPQGNPTPIFQADWSYLRLVAVYPDHNGKGIAKTLTQLCIDHAKQNNEHTVALHTSEFMDAARHIYEGFGFKQLKEIEPLFGKRYWIYTLDLDR